MAYSNENFVARILNVLNLPLMEKCGELTVLLDHCSMRELQEIFPTIVYSIFGVGTDGIGWGLRTITEENSQGLFLNLHQFFTINGVMIRTVHRLLNEMIKYDFDIDLLPHKVVAMLQSGQYSQFYADLFNIDPFRRQVTSLSLNAFDFYILHFVLHALLPLQRINQLLIQNDNERSKSIYYLLIADYLNNFMPAHAGAEVFPICNIPNIKTSQPIPTQTMQPKRVPRFIKIPSSYNNNVISGNSTIVSTSGPRPYAWRTESVLHFFIDNWLRLDIEGERDLPGTEFVRNVRLLIKQLHFFANSANVDSSMIASLRKIALPMVKTHIYSFLKGLIDRWPLDNSMIVVLELWLTYIQPWRYNISNNRIKGDTLYEPRIINYYDTFIVENLVMYTSIFIRLLPRFQRLDYTIYRNAFMLDRLVKIITQPSLGNKLKEIEKVYSGNSFGFDSTQGNSRNKRCFNIDDNSYDEEWNPLYNERIPKMFGESTRREVENLLFVLNESVFCVLNSVNDLDNKIYKKRKSQGFLKSILNNLSNNVSIEEQKLNELIPIPDILRQAMRSLCLLFEMHLTDVVMEKSFSCEASSKLEETSFFNDDDIFDITKLSPTQMTRNAANFISKIDPALLPLRSDEIPLLARILHVLSNKINELFGDTIQKLYIRKDFIGKIFRQLIYGPMTVQWFDKRHGCNDLFEDEIPARICLRPLASMKVISLILLSLLIGFVLWNEPLRGLIYLCALFIVYILILAVIT